MITNRRPQLTPILALLLTHDLLLAKKGVALPQTHGLNATISRHKARLSAELTKLRIRRGLASLDELRAHVNSENARDVHLNEDGTAPYRHPRWIRINTLKATLDEELSTTFANYTKVQHLGEITHAVPGSRMVYIDEHIPNLIATVGPEDPSSFKSYKTGRFIFQEKASCFPAYLLNPAPGGGNVIDACAAPGNKTTHLASILAESSLPEDGTNDAQSHVTACEKDAERSKTLEKMVKLAGANRNVVIKAKQDFLRIDPKKKESSNVTALLLDPSCSGSGIVGRDEASITVHLPSATAEEAASKGKKRKRGGKPLKAEPEVPVAIAEEEPDEVPEDDSKLMVRLGKLSTFQLRLLQHAMSFPAAQRITYSTCSVHAEENEHVVVKALLSDIAIQRGWSIMKRSDQIDGMQRWKKRGYEEAARVAASSENQSKASSKLNLAEVAEACIRCDKAGDDATMGFFVAGFMRDGSRSTQTAVTAEDSDDESDEFQGFSEDET